jgi:hypothetical protein
MRVLKDFAARLPGFLQAIFAEPLQSFKKLYSAC